MKGIHNARSRLEASLSGVRREALGRGTFNQGLEGEKSHQEAPSHGGYGSGWRM